MLAARDRTIHRQENILPKGPAGARRSIDRSPPARKTRATSASRFHRRSLELARAFMARFAAEASSRTEKGSPTSIKEWASRIRHTTRARIGSERAVPIGAALVLLAASAFSYAPTPATEANQGGSSALGAQPRLAVGGSQSREFEPISGSSDESYAPIELAGLLGGREKTALPGPGPLSEADSYLDGAFLDDGTLLKPIAVDTSIADSSGLLTRYRVQSGDNLVGIANKFDVSMMTVWWANKLASKDDLKVGQVLVIPPVTGLVVTVAEGDTLESLSEKHGIVSAEVLELNGLEDPTLVIGQTVILPGAAGAGIPTPKPTKRPVVSGGGSSVRPPVTYSGGAFAWPVSGGNNYISQYFRYGHYGLDIAATYGSTVWAAAAGTVQFAGWRSNGGGYQVWIAHGSGLYTTYSHLSAVTVGSGQTVGKGSQVGRVGSSGRSTGPHLHFEVWSGPIWNGGYRLNPLKYY